MQRKKFKTVHWAGNLRLLKLFVCIVALSILGEGVSSAAKADKKPSNACQLDGAHGNIQHAIYLVFDNTHFRRDSSNVVSDLEQMPSLLNFIKGNGTLLSNHHTVLIAHTAGGILSSLTGLYPDRNGIAVSNSYDSFRPNGMPTFTSAFKYWNDPVDAINDPLPNMVNGDSGTAKITPAPWLA